MKSIKIMHMTK